LTISYGSGCQFAAVTSYVSLVSALSSKSIKISLVLIHQLPCPHLAVQRGAAAITGGFHARRFIVGPAIELAFGDLTVILLI